MVAKTYVCDICGTGMRDPYKTKMREFDMKANFDYEYLISYKTKSSKHRKVHLCRNCYQTLIETSRKKMAGDTVE